MDARLMEIEMKLLNLSLAAARVPEKEMLALNRPDELFDKRLSHWDERHR